MMPCRPGCAASLHPPDARCSATLLAAVFLVAWPAVAQEPRRDILLANRHLAPVAQVYVSAATDPDWGPERLGGQPLAPGDDTTITLPRITPPGGCEADIRIVFPTGGAEERRAVDLCETTRVVLRPGWTVADTLDEDGPVPPLPGPGVAPTALRLRNAGPLPVVEIYTGPPGGPRGEDRLGADTLPIGAAIEIEPGEGSGCMAELVVVFRNGREVAQPGVDLCAGEEIEVQ